MTRPAPAAAAGTFSLRGRAGRGGGGGKGPEGSLLPRGRLVSVAPPAPQPGAGAPSGKLAPRGAPPPAPLSPVPVPARGDDRDSSCGRSGNHLSVRCRSPSRTCPAEGRRGPQDAFPGVPARPLVVARGALPCGLFGFLAFPGSRTRSAAGFLSWSPGAAPHGSGGAGGVPAWTPPLMLPCSPWKSAKSGSCIGQALLGSALGPPVERILGPLPPGVDPAAGCRRPSAAGAPRRRPSARRGCVPAADVHLYTRACNAGLRPPPHGRRHTAARGPLDGAPWPQASCPMVYGAPGSAAVAGRAERVLLCERQPGVWLCGRIWVALPPPAPHLLCT